MSASLASLYGEVMKLKKQRSVQRAFEEAANDPKYRLIDTLFTDKDRPGYHKHVDLMDQGAGYRSRLFIAANRVGKCLTYQTLVDTDKGKLTVGELFERGKEFNVIAWDGSSRVISRAAAPFKKEGLHECFRFEMSDGSVIEAADHHRILLNDGITWEFAEEIYHRFRAREPYRSAHGTFYCGSPSCLMPLLVDGNRIVSIKPIGRKEVYDFEVETFHNYVAGGLVHHNTLGGAYETALHLTGQYPDWWNGVRFSHETLCWAAGDTSKTTREFVQLALLGHEKGTGTIPGAAILRTTAKSGTADAVDTIEVKHVSGGVSRCVLKSYDQDIDAFMGGAVNFIWLDEEPPLKIFTECIVRTMTTGGGVLMTFTPVRGLSETVQHFMPSGVVPEPMPETCYIVQATWDDAPHLSEDQKRELYDALPPHQRDARSKGIPALGAGAIYPVPESEITVEPFAIPDHWPRAYGLDVGWKKTAAVWGAKDPDTGIVYLYSEYYRGEAEPSVHAAAIKARGDWIPGVIDPAARGRGQADGRQLLQDYIDLGLDIDVANNAVESGIYRGWELLSTGQLKVFSTMTNWLNEYRIYHRDEKGRIVKERDHCLSGDTLVWTDFGKIAIRDLVGTTGMVVGIDGRFVEYKACRQYGTDDVFKYSMDGKTIDCTADHLILTRNGWVAARDCFDGIGYNTISEHKYRIDLCRLKLSRAYQKTVASIKNFLGSATTCVESISSATGFACTESCTRMLMADVQKDAGGIYTISTETPQTITQKILSLFRRKITSCDTRLRKGRRGQESTPIESDRSLGIGMRQSKDVHGTGRTMLSTALRYMGGLLGNATIAAKSSFLQFLSGHPILFARSTARRHTEGSRRLTMKREHASFVDHHSWSTGTACRGLVAESAEVFCLFVPEGNGFVVNDGIIVHNCLDASRYFWMSGLDIARQKPVAREKREPQQYRGAKGWM